MGWNWSNDFVQGQSNDFSVSNLFFFICNWIFSCFHYFPVSSLLSIPHSLISSLQSNFCFCLFFYIAYFFWLFDILIYTLSKYIWLKIIDYGGYDELFTDMFSFIFI